MAKGQQRDPKREAFWRSVFARFAKSGLSIRAFCRREKVTEPAFYAWRREIHDRDQEPRPTPAFVPVVASDRSPETDARASEGIRVELPGGRILHLPSTMAAQRVAELVRAVESAPVEALA